MGEIGESHWRASRCKPDTSKGGIFKVYLSIPPELRTHYGKNELKKSTGTRDPKIAQRIQHEVTANWYNEFRAILRTDNYSRLVDTLCLSNVSYHFRYINDRPFTLTFSTRPESREEAYEAIKEISKAVSHLKDAYEENDAEYLLNSGILKRECEIGHKPKIGDILALQRLVEIEFENEFSDAKASINKHMTSTQFRNTSNQNLYPRASAFIENYFTSRKWEHNTSKEKQTSHTRICQCLQILGDPPLDQFLAQHGLYIAEDLESLEKANSTIKGYLTSLSGLLDYIRIHELNTNSVPPQPWITTNPLVGLPLANYGRAKKSFEALTEQQLHQLFSLEMNFEDRLCLELLITTGCRLDEIALLTWEQIKTDANHIRYIDLATNALVKNDNSKRLVPIPNIINLPERANGRIFTYTIDQNGKASRAAGKRLLEKYIHRIRSGPSDNRKTVHSLRHNFIGFLDNLNPPISEVLKDWITGHRATGKLNDSERKRTYGSDPDLSLKFEAVNRISHPWLKIAVRKT